MEDQVSLLYDLAIPPPLPLSRQQVVYHSHSSCVSPVDLPDGIRRRGSGWSQFIRLRESVPSINHSILSFLTPSFVLLLYVLGRACLRKLWVGRGGVQFQFQQRGYGQVELAHTGLETEANKYSRNTFEMVSFFGWSSLSSEREYFFQMVLLYFPLLYSTLLHLPPLRFHCIEGCSTVATSALTVRRSKHSARSHPEYFPYWLKLSP
jgi:hypothetical protein